MSAQIQHMTKLHAALAEHPQVAEFIPPDTNPGEWGVCYAESIWITWEPKRELYRVQMFHGRDVITVGYFPFDALLTTLKFVGQ